MQNSQLPPETDSATKRKRFLINFFFFALLFALSVVLVRNALPALFPFVIALIVSFILRPIVRFLATKCHLNRRAASVVLVLLFYATVGTVVILLVFELAQYAVSLIDKLPGFYRDQILPMLDQVGAVIQGIINNIDAESAISVDVAIDEIIATVGDAIKNFSTTVVGKVGDVAISVPTFMLNIVITIISSAFLLMDFDHIKKFFSAQLSEKTANTIHDIGTHLGKVLRKYILSYALIMFITFCEIFIGLTVIGVDYAAIIAGVIAIFDILPVVGSGFIIIPWAVITLVTGDFWTALGLVVLWVIVTVIRQIIEPKIIGSSVGMHPLLTLFAMLAGNFIYGGVGIFLLPITIALFQSLNQAGIIHLYKPVEREPESPSKLNIMVDKAIAATKNAILKPFKKKDGEKKKSKKSKKSKDDK